MEFLREYTDEQLKYRSMFIKTPKAKPVKEKLIIEQKLPTRFDCMRNCIIRIENFIKYNPTDTTDFIKCINALEFHISELKKEYLREPQIK